MPKKFSAFILALLLLGTLSTAAAASANSQTEVSVSFSGLSPENESAPALSYMKYRICREGCSARFRIRHGCNVQSKVPSLHQIIIFI